MARALPVPVLVAAVVGAALLAAGAYALLTDGNGTRSGEVITLAPPEPGSEAPICAEEHDFCVVDTASGLPRALYMYDTHPESRERGCEVVWDPEFDFVDPETGEDETGWFNGPCSGTTYRLNGERVFGPGQRNLDQFPLFFRGDEVEVHTGTLICGASPTEEDCHFAPEAE